MKIIIKLFCCLFVFLLISTPANAAKWGKVKAGDCNLATGERSFHARLWRKPFDKSGKKLCPIMAIKYKGKKYKSEQCKRGADFAYRGYFSKPDSTCSRLGPRLDLNNGANNSIAIDDQMKLLVLRFKNDKSLRKRLSAAMSGKNKEGVEQVMEGVEEYRTVRSTARSNGYQTFAISLAADLSLFIGLGADVSGIALDTALKSTREKAKWFASIYGTAGWVSFAAGGNIVFTTLKPPNYCLYGKSYGLTIATAIGLDISHTTWFSTKSDRKLLKDEFVSPNNLDRLKLGTSFAVGAGVGIEAVEKSTATTFQLKISDQQKEYCKSYFEAIDRDRESVISDIMN